MVVLSNYSAIIALSALSGLVHGQDPDQGMPRAFRSNHPIHVCDKDLQPSSTIKDAEESQGFLIREYQLNHHHHHHQEREKQELPYFMSLHFESFDLDPRCTLDIMDETDGIVSSLGGKGRRNMGTFWSEHTKGLSARLVLKCKEHETHDDYDDHNIVLISEAQFKVDFVIDQYVVIDRNRNAKPNLVFEKLNLVDLLENTEEEIVNDALPKSSGTQRSLNICSADDLKNIVCYENSHPKAFEAARSIVRMQYGTSDVCTGWMISPGLLMTAGHCVKSDEEALNTKYEFGFTSKSCNSDIFDNSSEIINAVSLVKFNKQADYALVRMEGNPGFKYGYLSPEKSLPKEQDLIYIPQHPAGRDKELAIFESSDKASNVGGLCHIKSTGSGSEDPTCPYGAAFKDFTYYCDTKGGSSGAPVMSVTNNKVIGLHHCGSVCENFAIPFWYIYDEVMALANDDIAKATPAEPPTTGGNATAVNSAAGRRMPLSVLGLVMVSLIAAI